MRKILVMKTIFSDKFCCFKETTYISIYFDFSTLEVFCQFILMFKSHCYACKSISTTFKMMYFYITHRKKNFNYFIVLFSLRCSWKARKSQGWRSNPWQCHVVMATTKRWWRNWHPVIHHWAQRSRSFHVDEGHNRWCNRHFLLCQRPCRREGILFPCLSQEWSGNIGTSGNGQSCNTKECFWYVSQSYPPSPEMTAAWSSSPLLHFANTINLICVEEKKWLTLCMKHWFECLNVIDMNYLYSWCLYVFVFYFSTLVSEYLVM